MGARILGALAMPSDEGEQVTSEGEAEQLATTIRETLYRYRASQIYITFAELGLGEALSNGPRTLDELARDCDAEPAALKRFLDAAIAFGLVSGDPARGIQLTSAAYEIFSPGGSRSMVNLLKLDGAFYERWSRLATTVRTGRRPPENLAQENEPEWVRKFTLALYDNAWQVAPAIAEAIDSALPESARRPLRIIDVGGGHGAYGMAIAERRHDVEVTVFDLPPVIDVTRELVEASNVHDRVTAVAGDFHRDPLGDGYDAALLFGVLHGETPENAEKLVRTLHDALQPDGLLLIRSQGHQRGASPTGERELFDLHMLLSTEGGEVRRALDTVEVVQRNGFRAEEPVSIPEPGSGTLLVFRRTG